ncbi:MAG: HEAT-like repeat-containing protein [Deltaproteobacteria bacterium]|nr:HEAT-like repeat-containing protein [Deltaproteobacteria bacterium]
MSDETKQQVYSRDGLDNRLVFDFIRTMNIARRNLVAYPRGHALVLESFEKVRVILQDFFEYSNHFTFGIAKDTLMLGTKALDRKNPVFQNFAQILFEHGIVSMTFFRDITVDELMDFDHIVSQKRNDVHHQGGVAALLSKAKVQNIKVQLIDYRMFQAQEGPLSAELDKENNQDSLFWWQFVRGVMDGALDPLGVPSNGWEDIDPEALATILNEQFARGGGAPVRQPGGGISGGEGPGEGDGSGSSGEGFGDSGPVKGGPSFDAFLDVRRFDFAQLAYDETSTARLNRFVQSLDQNLRKVFVERFFSSFSHNIGALNQLIPSLSDDIIIDALEKNTKKELYLPPNILDILTRLKKESANIDPDVTDELLGGISKDELSEKFSIIFKEDEVDRFVPLDYQKILHDVVVAETLSAPELSQVHQLEDTLSSHSMNMHLTSVVVDIITKQGCGEAPPYLMRSLKGCCMYLIFLGDFHAVSDIYETVARTSIFSGDRERVTPSGILEVFSDDDFIGDVLDAPAQWGKEKDFYIVELIKRIGSPFVEPLLDRLASEEDRTLRYFYLDLLGQLGTMVRESAIRRLNDNRWFLVRNLIILLRNLNDPSVLPSLHGLLEHPHPRVRHELMQTLIKFNDPVAERIILQEMDSPDTSRCLKAIALAGMTRNKLISQKLLEFLHQRGLGKSILPIKKASVHALGEIGDPFVLPALQDILKSRVFFRRHAAANLKLEIIESLRKYPPGEVSPILRVVVNSGPQALVDHALMVMKNIEVSPS